MSSPITRLYSTFQHDLDAADALHMKGRKKEALAKLEEIDQRIGAIYPKSVFWAQLKELDFSKIRETYVNLASYRAVEFLQTKHIRKDSTLIQTRHDSFSRVTDEGIIWYALDELTDSMRKAAIERLESSALTAIGSLVVAPIALLFSPRKQAIVALGALGTVARFAYKAYQLMGNEPPAAASPGLESLQKSQFDSDLQ